MIYEEVHIHTSFFADLVVEDQIIVEIKAVDAIAPVHRKQLLTYLKLADKRLGLERMISRRDAETSEKIRRALFR